jgi:membrane fusion protein (multidrug efflux system)
LPPENATGNYVKVVQRIPVRIAIDHRSDPQHLLRAGMSVVPTIFTERSYEDILQELNPFH